jgi:two-component SAPR family response regulator
MNPLNTPPSAQSHWQSPPLWRATLLGDLAAVAQDRSERRVTRFRSQKYGALLAYLAYHRHAPHSREALIALLWPEMEERAGRNDLSVALSSLRNQLEPPGTPPGVVLLFQSEMTAAGNYDPQAFDWPDYRQSIMALRNRWNAESGDRP